MADICPTCGLPLDICVCGTITREQQRIRVYRELRKLAYETHSSMALVIETAIIFYLKDKLGINILSGEK